MFKPLLFAAELMIPDVHIYKDGEKEGQWS